MTRLVKLLSLLILFAVLAAQQAGAADTKPKAIPLSGKVLETMDGGGYTYVNLQNGPEKVWVAIPLTKVKVGQQLSLMPGFEMKNFTSKGLNRKFDKVIFSGGLANAEKIQMSPSAIKAVHQGVPGAQGAAQGTAAPKAAPAAAPAPAPVSKSQKVTKAKGPNAYTIAEIYAKSKKLEKKPVVVRGRVVRVSQKIMKRNWIHLVDGTGSKAKKTDDLVITSQDLPREGDVVTVSGTLYNNLDFGSGYRYNVLVQDAKFKK
ncbi:DNA-binding protein [Geomonas subterranea]|uniref:DNA-binding protein n=1 Tax=Geomonas subterranea TaxID=2847989 RepID=A0ABX8LLG2_9BACT|nr:MULTISPECIES: DNA-binding protein [Geomonas]QXE92533.1 DNA-binding protein [Geomonas subterranea]QXM09367.1 DNA-binding protein [Geomonas subterranea]